MCYNQVTYMAKPPSDIHSRFWSKVNKTSNIEECWFWTASVNCLSGYGQFGIAKGQLGRKTASMQPAHRVAWMLTHGEIPQDMYVCHTCDRPSCVNPSHLFLGTQSDNMRDCVNKNRHGYGTVGNPLYYTAEKREKIYEAYRSGERISTITERYEISETHLLRLLKMSKIPLREIDINRRKLTSVEVRQIRELYAVGNVSTYELGDRFRINRATILQIVSGKTWRELPVLDHPRKLSKALTPEQVREIRAARASGATYPELSERFGKSVSTIAYCLLHRKL